jgi:hypothetical protein
VSSDFQAVVEGMELIRQRKEAELKKLCANPEIIDVAQELTDSFLRCLHYLFNYQTVIDGIGVHHDIQEVYSGVQDLVCEEFKELTGRQYVPTVCRTNALRKTREIQ